MEYRELVNRLFPVVGCSCQVPVAVKRCQPDRLGHCVVVGEVSSVPDNFAQTSIRALNQPSKIKRDLHLACFGIPLRYKPLPVLNGSDVID